MGIFDEPDIADALKIAQDRSLFRHMMFTGLVSLLEAEGHKYRYDASDSDLVRFMENAAVALRTLTTINVVYGLDDSGKELSVACDPITTQLIKVGYYLKCNPFHRTYFLGDGVTAALENTKLDWMDLEVFAALPSMFTLKVPPGIFNMTVLGETYKLEDIVVIKLSTQMVRRLILTQHKSEAKLNDPNTHVFYWLAASRDELAQGIHNFTFGSFMVDADMKLDNMLDRLDEWGEDQVRNLVNAVTPGLFARLEGEGIARDIELLLTGKIEPGHYARSTEYIKGIFDIDALREEVKRNRHLLEFIFKFVMLRGSEQFKEMITEKQTPGFKPGKLSRKAQGIQERLREEYGWRVYVGIPKQPAQERGEMLRHHVQGFFRRQAYGPKHSLRKIIWVAGFFRGSRVI